MSGRPFTTWNLSKLRQGPLGHRAEWFVVQLVLAPSGDDDVRAFLDEQLRSLEACFIAVPVCCVRCRGTSTLLCR
jgi:hypothetical protein